MTAGGPEPARWTRRLKRSAIQDALVRSTREDVLSLALGLPAPELLPTGPLGEALTGVLRSDTRALQYGPPSAELRAFVTRLARRRGIACEPEQVHLTAGAQQGMSLLARLLLDPGDPVLVEEHCYTGFQQAIAPFEPRVLTVPSSLEDGLDVAAVERALASGPRPALLYVVPDGHNPLGVSMPVASRRRLAELARAAALPVIEDDAYGLLSYDGEEVSALRAFEAEWVFHVGSFSKTLAPGLRAGWVIVPERFVEPLAALKESSDIDTATLAQRAIAAFVATGAFDGHVARLRSEYGRRRDAMLAAVAGAFPAPARWSRPRAGFFTWLDLGAETDAGRLFDAALECERVAFVPGAAFVAGDARPARSALRLSFSFHPPEVLGEGVARIAGALERLRAGRAAV